MKRTGKFYYKNEKEVLSKLGLTPAPGSGSGWIVKEDGENETVMVQLKSTDAESYKLNLFDIKQLEYHALVSHKVPIFLIQFLQRNKIYALVSVDNINELYKAFELGERPETTTVLEEQEEVKKQIKSTKQAREQFFEERREYYGKRKRRRND